MEYLSIKEAQELANVHINTIRNWIKSDKIKYNTEQKGLTPVYKIHKKEFLQFLKDNNINQSIFL